MIQEYWQNFQNSTKNIGEDYSAWAFGGAEEVADELAQLVLEGRKTATASLHILYEIEEEELPRVGEYSVILNSQGEPICIIQTTVVKLIPFDQVPVAHAVKEGEGDLSYEYWKKVHIEFFTAEALEYHREFSGTDIIVCEEFQVVYPNERDSIG